MMKAWVNDSRRDVNVSEVLLLFQMLTANDCHFKADSNMEMYGHSPSFLNLTAISPDFC